MATAQKATACFNIVKTAPIDDVFLALRTAFMGARIQLTVEDGRVFSLSVHSLYHEDGSGHSLIIGGFAQPAHTVSMPKNIQTYNRFEAWFDYRGDNPKGWIKFLD